MSTELILGQPKEKSFIEDKIDIRSRLEPLLENKAVALTVRDLKSFPKKRIPTPVLFLQPGEIFGSAGMDSLLVISLWGHGCEVVDVRDEIRVITFHRVGVSAKIGKVLVRELNELYSNRRR